MKPYSDYSSRAKSLFIVLVVIEAVLVLSYVNSLIFFDKDDAVFKLFDLNGESNIPTWFSSIQLFTVGLFFLLLAEKAKSSPLHSNSSAQRLSWTFLLFISSGFIFLSADEAICIHEYITGRLSGIEALPRFNDGHGIWIPIYITIFATSTLATYRHILAIWKHNRRAFLIIATGLGSALIGGIGLEIVSYQFKLGGLYHPEVIFEEFLEMFGVSLILYGSLSLPPFFSEHHD